MGKRKGKCAKKNSTTKQGLEPENLVKAPHSFVIHRGHCGKDLVDLTKDFRKIMEPFTASQLKERKKNTIKDFVSVSGYLHVSHMMVFTETELGCYMRLARLPRGPTLTFKIHNYCLARDVVSSLRRQYVVARAFQHAPLVVLNSFSGEGRHMKLMATMFQNMFPTINITSVKLKNIRRCVLLNYNPSTKAVDLRHYVIRATPVGLNKGTKKVVQGKIPNLNRCKDISEFFDKAALLSESEAEDEAAQVVLPQALAGRGAAADSRSALRLHELGPRLSLQLIKVEDGLMDGEVLFHELVEKTEEEKAAIKKKRDAKKKQKEKRKTQQEENVKRKQREKEEQKQRALEGIRRKRDLTESQRLMELAEAESRGGGEGGGGEDEDDDAQYYRDEVGAEPDQDLFSAPRKRKAGDDTVRGFKKMRLDKKLKKKYEPGQKGAPPGRPRRGDSPQRGGGGRTPHRNKEHFQNKDGGRQFNKGGNPQNREGGRRFQNNQDGRNYQGKKGGREGKGFNKPKKVFGGKVNKFKSGKGKGKGKGRK